MQKLSISALENTSFRVKSSKLEESTFKRHDMMDDDPYFESFFGGEIVLQSGDLLIEAGWQATGGHKTYSDAHEFEFECPTEYTETNFILIDEDGKEIKGRERLRLLEEAMLEVKGDSIWRHIQKHLPEAESLDLHEEENMTEGLEEAEEFDEFEVQRDDDKSISFRGKLLAKSSSYEHSGNRSTRWTVLRLYKTKGGKFICSEIGETRWQGERDRFKGKVCSTIDEVKEFFGYGWLAKELYDNADIDYAEVVE